MTDPSTNNPATPHWHYTYDPRGLQLTQTDPNGHETDFAYDDFGNRTSRTLPAVASVTVTESWTYDGYGRTKTHTDFNAQITQYVYDDSAASDVYGTALDIPFGRAHTGRLIEERRYTDDTAYNDGSGTPVETTRYAYDDLGRQTAVGEFTGVPDTSTVPTRLVTTDYDPLTGGVVMVDSPEGIVHHAYDPATGRLTDTWTGDTSNPALGTTHTIYGYDTLGRLASVTADRVNSAAPAAPAVILRKWTDLATATNLDLDGSDLVVYYQGATPLDAIIGMVNSGIIHSVAAGLPHPTALAVVDNSQLHLTSWAGHPLAGDYKQVIVTFAYLGDVSLDGQVTTADYSTIYSHLGRAGGWVDGDVNGDGFVTAADLAIVAANLGAGNGTTGGPLLTPGWAASLGTQDPTTYTYDLDGNLVCESLPNGLTENYDYDSLNRLYHVLVKDAAGHNLFEQTYTLESDGQRDYVVEKRWDGVSSTPFSKVKIDWAYDKENRLIAETRDADTTPGNAGDDFGTCDLANGTTVTSDDYTTFFTLDLAGNRMALQCGWDANADGQADTGEIDSATAYTYNERDQLMAEGADTDANGIPDPAAATTYLYDDNGSTLTVTTHTGGAITGLTTHTWDLRNRLVAYDAPGTTNDTTYTYDSDGIRVSKIVNGVGTYFLNDKANPTGYTKPIEERTTLGGNPVLTYTLGLTVTAQTNDSGAGVITYLIRDGHGYARALANASGAVTDTADFDAFGNFVGNADFGTNWFGCDGYFDRETGQYYNLARYRKDFRFMSWDSYEANSADPMTLHKYLYANASPIMWSDPSGPRLLPKSSSLQHSCSC